MALISSLNEVSTTTLAPISSFWALGSTFLLGLAEATKTADKVKRYPECVLNLPAPEMWPQVEKLAPLPAKSRIGSESWPWKWKSCVSAPPASSFSTNATLIPQSGPADLQFPPLFRLATQELGKAFRAGASPKCFVPHPRPVATHRSHSSCKVDYSATPPFSIIYPR